jgi:hypothetical protein
LSVLLLANGCVQAPLVPTRTISYEVTLSINGERRQVATQYQCHFEDVSWFSQRGSQWHIRASNTRIVSAEVSASNGRTFWISTLGDDRAKSRDGGPLCPQQTVRVTSHPTANRPSMTGAWRGVPEVEILKSELVLLGTGLDFYRDRR